MRGLGVENYERGVSREPRIARMALGFPVRKRAPASPYTFVSGRVKKYSGGTSTGVSRMSLCSSLSASELSYAFYVYLRWKFKVAVPPYWASII